MLTKFAFKNQVPLYLIALRISEAKKLLLTFIFQVTPDEFVMHIFAFELEVPRFVEALRK